MCFSLMALPAHPVGLEASSRPHRSAVLLFLLLFFSSCRSRFLSAGVEMKKDIETLIAEERADIILKYATVSLSLLFGPDGSVRDCVHCKNVCSYIISVLCVIIL